MTSMWLPYDRERVARELTGARMPAVQRVPGRLSADGGAVQ